MKGYYRHYKGGLYQVLYEAKHSETLEDLVVYQSLKDFQVWVRPKLMFYSTVTYEGRSVPRFLAVDEEKAMH